MKRVGVVFGGPSPEHDISILTGLQVCRSLKDYCQEVVAIFWSKSGEFYSVSPNLEATSFRSGVPPKAQALALQISKSGGFVQGGGGVLSKAKSIELEAVVNCCHGGPGEDGSLQAALDLAHVAYTGPTVRSAALGMDKLAFVGLLSSLSIPHLPRSYVDEESMELPFDGPYILKPRFGGSSIGIEVVADISTLKMRLKGSVHLRAGTVVEPYRADLFDLQVAVKSWPEFALSQIERPLRSHSIAEILSYGDKYIAGEGMATAPRELPAKLDPSLEHKIRSYAEKVYVAIGGRGVSRVDFLASEQGELYLNEINTIPGSLSHYLWNDPKLPFSSLLLQLIEEAQMSKSYLHLTAGADGSVLDSAGSIALKLS